MNGLTGGIMKLIVLPFKIFKPIYSLVSGPFKFISEHIEIERQYETKKSKFIAMKKRSRQSNDEII